MQNPLQFDLGLARGKQFNIYNSAFKKGKFDLKQGMFDKNQYCSLCRQTAHVLETVTCSMCSRKFHTNCLPDKITRNTVSCLSKNPSLWWFCLECLHIANSFDNPILNMSNISRLSCNDHNCESESNFVSKNHENGETSSSVTEKQLSDFKNEIIAQVNDEIDQKLTRLAVSAQNPNQEFLALENFLSDSSGSQDNYHLPDSLLSVSDGSYIGSKSGKKNMLPPKLQNIRTSTPLKKTVDGYSSSSSSSGFSDIRSSISDSRPISPAPRPSFSKVTSDKTKSSKKQCKTGQKLNSNSINGTVFRTHDKPVPTRNNVSGIDVGCKVSGDSVTPLSPRSERKVRFDTSRSGGGYVTPFSPSSERRTRSNSEDPISPAIERRARNSSDLKEIKNLVAMCGNLGNMKPAARKNLV